MALDPLEIIGGLAIGEGLGGAIADTVTPRLQNFKNAQWQAHQDVPLSPAEAAALAAQAYTGSYDGAGDAASGGIDGDRYLALRFLAATAPGTPELLELWRRGRLSEQLVRDGLKKSGLLDEFVDAVLELFVGRLDPAVVATAIQRGIMKDPGFLPVGPPAGVGDVPAFPVSPLDPLAEAQAQGIDSDRLFVETAIVGLPLSLQEAASAYFRGIIQLDDFKRAVAEGNTRNEWGDAALEQARQILTASEYAELQLRGFLTETERQALTAKHGMSQADSDLLYDVLGRGLSVHQILIGLRRGGTYGGPTGQIPPEYLAALRRGNIRPEFYNLAYAARETFPSYFVIRALLQAGVISAQRGQELFDGLGWPADVAKAAGDFFGASTTAAADKHVTKAENSLWTALHSSYVKDRTDDATATSTMGTLGVAATAVPDVLALWQAERALVRAGLSAAQIKKAFREATFTQDEAVARLVELGWSVADAGVYLAE